jgi:hypothetical protein
MKRRRVAELEAQLEKEREARRGAQSWLEHCEDLLDEYGISRDEMVGNGCFSTSTTAIRVSPTIKATVKTVRAALIEAEEAKRQPVGFWRDGRTGLVTPLVDVPWPGDPTG